MDFSSSIGEELVIKSLKFVGSYTSVPNEDLILLNNARNSVLYDKETCGARREQITPVLFFMQRRDRLWVQNYMN